MNKADLSRALKNSPGNTLKPVQVLTEEGDIFEIDKLVFDVENDVFYLQVKYLPH